MIAVIVFSSNGESGDGPIADHGYSQEEVLAKGGQVRTINLVKGISTTNLIRRIKDLD